MRVQSDMQSMLNYGYENVDLIKKIWQKISVMKRMLEVSYIVIESLLNKPLTVRQRQEPRPGSPRAYL